MKRAAAILLCMILCALTVSSGQDQVRAADLVMKAMSDELDRTMLELRLKDLEKPYFVQYIAVDEKEYSGQATFGALTSWNPVNQRVLQVQVRVGSYDMDNSEFSMGRADTSSTPIVQTSLDNDYRVLRHSLWLATDAAYKRAVEMLARKRAFLQNKVQDENAPDFSREIATQSIQARQGLKFDADDWKQHLRDWSRIFQAYPEIQSSRVGLIVRLTHRYLVNSEGTRVLQPSLLVLVEAEGSTQAPDGMQIFHSVPFYAKNFADLPTSKEIENGIRKLAEELKALRSAPVFKEDYSGPVLLTGPASPDFFGRVLAMSLTGQRGPVSDRLQQGGRAASLLDRMNRPILPSYFSVSDDPSLQRFGTDPLIGYYTIDDQGVPAQRVSLVESGILSNLLMSRRPIAGYLNSNGHGRSGYPGRESAQISNLVITARAGKTYEELKQELIRLCREERLSYGIVIKALLQAPGVIAPALVYRVNVEDGKEELVRGVSPTTFPVRSLRHIQAAGNEMTVTNRLTGTPGAETPVSVVAPSILLEEMELKRAAGAQQGPALLTQP